MTRTLQVGQGQFAAIGPQHIPWQALLLSGAAPLQPEMVRRQEAHPARAMDGKLKRLTLAWATGVSSLCQKVSRSRMHRLCWKFVSRHPELAKITSAIAKGDGSKGRVWPTAPPRRASSRNAQEIGSFASFVRWLHSMMVRG